MNKQEKWRIGALGTLMFICFAVLIVRLANLQVRPEDDYADIAQSAITKTISERGERGQILDVNGTVLAYNKKIYNVEFYRSPSSNQAQNGAYSRSIWQTIQLLEREGKEVSFPFWMKLDENGEWVFDFDTEDESVAQRREEMFRSNFYVKNKDVNTIFDILCENYLRINKDDEFDPSLTIDDKIQILGVWQEMQMNAFNSVPIILCSDIKWSTVMEIETRMATLSGISISVESQRVYPQGALACHILGYTGLIQSNEALESYLENGYQRNDTVGLYGVEKTMEEWLTGNSALRRGYTIWEVDRSGRRVRSLERVAPVDGNTVKLTIDSSLQRVVETELDTIVNAIRDEEESRIKRSDWIQKNIDALQAYQDRTVNLAETGAIVVLDMDARVLAMASFPNFDPNLFITGMTEEQYERTLKDHRNPLFNYAIQAKSTPGSVFKMCTALAALANGTVTVDTEISDGGFFTRFDDSSTAPRCWISKGYESRHANMNTVTALQNSCNYYFYTIAADMDEQGDKLYEFAAKLGLTSKTNIDLPYEEKSVVGSQATLYDPSQPITGTAQGTWYPVQIKASLKTHLRMIGEMYNITYTDERLDRCIKSLMDMAVTTSQGEKLATWITNIRTILMDELGMSMEMVYLAATMSPITSYLNEIKWGGSYTIQTAIGQGVTTITPIAMARYIVAIANGGYVYDVQLIDSIISPTGEVVQSFDEPVLVNDLSGEIGQYLPYIAEGMRNVVDEGTASDVFIGWEFRGETAGKTGTAETSNLDVEHNSWFVAFAPISDPQIAIVVYVPHGMSGKMSAPAAKNVLDYYLRSQTTETELILPASNGLAQ